MVNEILEGINTKLSSVGSWCGYWYNERTNNMSISIETFCNHDVYSYLVGVENKKSDEVADEVCKMFLNDFTIDSIKKQKEKNKEVQKI